MSVGRASGYGRDPGRILRHGNVAGPPADGTDAETAKKPRMVSEELVARLR